MDLSNVVNPVVSLAIEAGTAILEVYATEFDVQVKDDRSPLTRADMASHTLIVEGLERLTPGIPIVSEESGLPDFETRSRWPRYWLIDPLDGTKEFVKRNDEFTVNIAMIEDRSPAFGVVHVPVGGDTYIGCRGYGAERRGAGGEVTKLAVATVSASPVRVVGSRSHRGASLDSFLRALGEHVMHPVGSSLKFCLVAEGRADVYPRLGPTSEWDTAAAQAVVVEAGGAVLTLDGKPLTYNSKAEILNPHFLVVGPRDRNWLALIAGQA